jgi:hypothetical protein
MKKTIKSVQSVNLDEITSRQMADSTSMLSVTEKSQLGNDGYPDRKTWCQIRLFLEERSMVSNPLLNKYMTAYTPAETLKLMEKQPIKEWLDNVKNLKIPESADVVIFVPCAKTKPWKDAPRGIYKSYNKVINENSDNVYFVTISEPLGVVPQNNWNDFPQYDNPGLFKDVVQRSGGLFTKDWQEHFGQRYKLPWDQVAYDKAIDILADKIKLFVNNNQKQGRQFISFVGDEKTIGTHQDMINRAGVIPKENQFLKRAEAREEPYEYIKDKLSNIFMKKDIVSFIKNKANELQPSKTVKLKKDH